jgi:hypothetical protein
MFFQSGSKLYVFFRQKDEASGDKKAVSFAELKYKGAPIGTKYHALTLCGDRAIGNMVEQALPFLLALWMHGALVNVNTAAMFGWIWLWLRALYPVVFFIGPPFLYMSTMPGYMCIIALCTPLARAVM